MLFISQGILGVLSYTFLGSFYLGLALFVYSIKVCALFLGIKEGAVLFCNVYEFFRDNRFLSTLHCKMCISTMLIHFCTKIARLRTLVTNSNQLLGN